jgi:hypothetical protein
MTIIHVAIVDWNVLGLVPWNLPQAYPHMAYYFATFQAIKAVQLLLILSNRTLYWRIRLPYTFCTKAFLGLIYLPAVLHCGTHRPEFLETHWMGVPDGGPVTSGSTVSAAARDFQAGSSSARAVDHPHARAPECSVALWEQPRWG